MADTGRDRAEQVIAGVLLQPGRAATLAADLVAALLDGPDAPAVLREEWDEDCGQQFGHGRAQGRDDLAADLAPLLALHRTHRVGGTLWCVECTATPWPCPTVAALPEHLRTEATR